MRSSTSNSESPPQWPETYWKRPIPTAHWRAVGIMTLLIVGVFFALWEWRWRSEGYEPGFENTADLWSYQRAKVGTHGHDETVIIGSSRILFGFDMDMWIQEFPGPRPINLAVVGTCPLPVLSDIANDESFTGTVLCGVTEGIFFIPAPAPPAAMVQVFVDHYKNWSPSAKASLIASIPVESAFAFMNREDLKLDALIRRWIPIKNRPNAKVLPPYPPYFARIEFDGRNKMWSRMETDPALQEKVQQIWLPLFQMAPPFGGPGLDELFKSITADVQKIRDRGGKVVFIRYPSDGELLNIERSMWPREPFWDRLLVETGAPGIHYEDHDGLNGYRLPEWSHLTRADAVTFTRHLAHVYREVVGKE